MNREQIPLVVVFSTSFFPFVGGAEVAIAKIAARIKSFRFIVVTARMSRSLPKREIMDEIEIYRAGFGFSFDKWLLPVFGFLYGRRLVRKNRDIIMWGMMISQGTLAAYMLKKIYKGVPLVITLQEGDSDAHLMRGRLGFIRYFWKKVLSFSNCVTAISRHLEDLSRKAGYIGEVHLVPNGVDERYFKPRRKEGRLVAESYGISDSEKIILSVSRLVQKNGVFELLRAFSLLHKRRKGVRLVFIGDGVEKQKLQERASMWNLGKSALFLGSFPHDELLDFYAMSDVFVRPSRSEGLGSAFLEAMAAGIPVVGTNVGGISDFLKDEETGIVVDAGSPESIANGIERILDNGELSNKISSNAQKLVFDKYQWEQIAKKMELIFLGAK